MNNEKYLEHLSTAEETREFAKMARRRMLWNRIEKDLAEGHLESGFRCSEYTFSVIREFQDELLERGFTVEFVKRGDRPTINVRAEMMGDFPTKQDSYVISWALLASNSDTA